MNQLDEPMNQLDDVAGHRAPYTVRLTWPVVMRSSMAAILVAAKDVSHTTGHAWSQPPSLSSAMPLLLVMLIYCMFLFTVCFCVVSLD